MTKEIIFSCHEIINHPSHAFLRKWAEEKGEQQVMDFLQVFRMTHGKAHVDDRQSKAKAGSQTCRIPASR